MKDVDITLSCKIDEDGLLEAIEELADFPAAIVFVGGSNDHIRAFMNHWQDLVGKSRCRQAHFKVANRAYILNEKLVEEASYICVGIDCELCSDAEVRRGVIQQLRTLKVQTVVMIWVDYYPSDPLPDWSDNPRTKTSIKSDADDTRVFDWNASSVRACPPREEEADCLVHFKPRTKNIPKEVNPI